MLKFDAKRIFYRHFCFARDLDKTADNAIDC